jgi:hypothetical protein
LKREINKSLQKGILYIGGSFFLFLVAYSLRIVPTSNAVFTTLVEGVNIVGWVFLWEVSPRLRSEKEMCETRKNIMNASPEQKYASNMPPPNLQTLNNHTLT